MSDLLALAERLAAQAQPGEDVEVYAERTTEVEIRAYEGAVESLARADAAGVGVRVVRAGRQGFAYAATLDEGILADALRDARDNAGFAEEDPHQGLVAPDGVRPADVRLEDPALAAASIDQKVDLALALERAARAADPRIVGIESADYVDATSEVAIASTAGISATSAETSCYLAVYALAEADGETQTGFGFSVGREPGVLDAERAAHDAARRATRLLGSHKPPTIRTTVVLEPWVTAQLLEVVAGTLDAESVVKGRSLFAERVGEPVAAPLVTFLDDPTEPAAFGAAAIDAEGLATRRNVLVQDGVLQGFVHNGYTARRVGTSSTGSAVRAGFRSTPGVGTMAVRLEPGDASHEALVAGVDDGILVVDVAGIHSGVNPVSGDFSTGAEGLRISGGAVGAPLREFTIASTLQRLLLGIRCVGADLTWLPMGAAGMSLVIEDVTVSGT